MKRISFHTVCFPLHNHAHTPCCSNVLFQRTVLINVVFLSQIQKRRRNCQYKLCNRYSNNSAQVESPDFALDRPPVLGQASN